MDHRIKLFLRPLLGGYFCGFGHALTPRCSILGPPWRLAGSQMAPKIAQVVPKMLQKLSRAVLGRISSYELAPKVAFGALLGTMLVDLGCFCYMKFNGFVHTC